MAMAVIKFWGYAKIVHRWLLSGGLVQTDICPVVFSNSGENIHVNFYVVLMADEMICISVDIFVNGNDVVTPAQMLP